MTMRTGECPKSCDTFVCLADCTADNVVIFGKNSDRPSEEVQEIVYYPKASYEENVKVKCTHIEVDQAPETAAVILSKPVWMWGAEMGSNSYGVCIGNEAIWGRLEAESAKKLLGMDLVRLGLERSKSAREAVDIVTNLLEKYGQGGPCSDIMDMTYDNSYLIADSKEAWILETAGKFWAAEHIESGHRNISNGFSIQTKIDLMSDGLKEEAEKLGFWTPSTEFNFAKAFGDGSKCSRFRQGKRVLEIHSKDKRFDMKSMVSILCNTKSGINMGGYDGGFGSTSSQVSVLRGSGNGLSSHWFTGTPDPLHSIFKPFLFVDGVSNSSTALTSCPENNPNGDYKHSLYRIHEASYKKICKSDLEALQDSLFSKVEQEISVLIGTNASHSRSILNNIFNEAAKDEINIYATLGKN